MWPVSQFQALFNFQIILCKKDFEEDSMLTWTNFDSFAITYLMQVDCFKNFIFQQKLYLILCKYKRASNQFQDSVLVEFFYEIFSFVVKFHYNGLCLLPKLFSKMYFLFFGQVFDDVMKFENVEFKILIFSITKGAFEVK